MSLADTDIGRAWIDNFPAEKRLIATKLLSAFVLDGWDVARATLVSQTRAELGQPGPSWVIPVMDSGDIRRANALAISEHLVAFQNFAPGMNIPSMPGSEGLVGHLIRDLQGEQVIPPTATLNQLRQRRVRSIILVSDTIETGGQVVKYARALLKNPTLKSWHSSKLIQLRVVAYSASAVGALAVRRAREVDSLVYHRQVPTVKTLPWPTGEIEEALDLCITYSRGTLPLGFEHQGSLFGFQDRVPNTVPRIFRQKGRDWNPLFQGNSGRLVPTDLIAELVEQTTESPDYEELIRAVRQERMAVSVLKQQRDSNRTILTALAMLRVSPERADILGVALSLSQSQTSSLLAYLRSQGWISPDNIITPAGVQELSVSKRRPRRVARNAATAPALPYYPQSLR